MVLFVLLLLLLFLYLFLLCDHLLFVLSLHFVFTLSLSLLLSFSPTSSFSFSLPIRSILSSPVLLNRSFFPLNSQTLLILLLHVLYCCGRCLMPICSLVRHTNSIQICFALLSLQIKMMKKTKSSK